MASIGQNGTHDLTLASDATGTPTTSISLNISVDPKKGKLWSERRLNPTAPRRAEGPIQYADRDPYHDLVWSMDDWSGGGMVAKWDPQRHNSYAQANGLDLRWKNIATLGMAKAGPVDFLLRNGGAELGATTGWTSGAGTFSASTTFSRTGTYSFKLAAASANDEFHQAPANPEVYRGTAITVYAYARLSGGTSASAAIRVTDSSGSSTGGAVVLTTSWQLIQVTKTIDSASTILTIYLLVTAQVGNPDVYVDDIVVVPAGGVVCAGMAQGQEEMLYNGEGEINSTTGWTIGANGAITQDTASPYSGAANFKMASSSGSVDFYQSVASPTSYIGKTVFFSAYVKPGTNAPTTTIWIGDGDGTSKTSSSGGGVGWNQVTVSHTVVAGTTALRLGVTIAGGAVALDAGVDLMHAYATPALDTAPLYGLFGRCVCKWNSTNSMWDAVYIHATATATSMVSYNQTLFVGFGNGNNAYLYGLGTGWAPSAITGNAKYAHFFRVSRQTLWKSRFDGPTGLHIYLASSTNPGAGGSWSGEYTVGSTERAITGLYDFLDTLLVGKVDGLYSYLRTYMDGTSADLFENVTNEYRTSPSSDNFAQGQESKTKLYLSASQQSFFSYERHSFYDRFTLSDLSGAFFSPRLTDFGGRIRAMASDTAQLYLLADTPTTNTTPTKTTWLMSLRPNFPPHVMEQVSIGDINCLTVNNGFLWGAGRLYNSDAADYVAAIYRWTLPTYTVAPALDASPAINTTGTFDTYVMDWGMPDEHKAFISLSVFTKPSVLNQTGRGIKVEFRLDGATSWTTLTTFTGAGAVQTADFGAISSPEANAVGRSIQLRFTFTTNASSDTVNPQLYAFALHGTIRPPRVKIFTFEVEFGDTVETLMRGDVDTGDRNTAISALQTLETQDYPIFLREALTDPKAANGTTYRGYIVPGSIHRMPEDTATRGERWGLEFIERVTS